MVPGPVSLVIFFVFIVTCTAALLAAQCRLLGVGLLAWLVLTGIAGWLGLVRDFQRIPPPMLLLLLAAALLTTVTAFSRIGSRLLVEAGIAWLVGMQGFRIAVELFLDWGHRAGLVPIQMTFEGRNWDIVSGVLAVGVAWLAARNQAPRWLIFVWNCIGAALLLNIVVVAILSMPTALRRFYNEPANTFVAYFPYIWLPAFLVQVALFGHLLVFRWFATREPRSESPELPPS